jgi:hypothetical protein
LPAHDVIQKFRELRREQIARILFRDFLQRRRRLVVAQITPGAQGAKQVCVLPLRSHRPGAVQEPRRSAGILVGMAIKVQRRRAELHHGVVGKFFRGREDGFRARIETKQFLAEMSKRIGGGRHGGIVSCDAMGAPRRQTELTLASVLVTEAAKGIHPAFRPAGELLNSGDRVSY